jgi:rhodanese-related sulfurtransferase
VSSIEASAVAQTPAASPDEARSHFARRLAFETDADDVAAALREGNVDFVLVDTRSREAYDAAHLPGAVSLPHREMDEATVGRLPDGLVVVYCWGPGCNSATKGAVKLAALGRPVKEMLGGFEYYVREGHAVTGSSAASLRTAGDPLVTIPHGVSCGC